MCVDLDKAGLKQTWNDDHKKRPNHYRHLRDLSIDLFSTADPAKKKAAMQKLEKLSKELITWTDELYNSRGMMQTAQRSASSFEHEWIE